MPGAVRKLQLQQPAVDQWLKVEGAELGAMGDAEQCHQLRLAAGGITRRQQLALLFGKFVNRARSPAAPIAPPIRLVSDQAFHAHWSLVTD
jgi:hypothetical protein